MKKLIIFLFSCILCTLSFSVAAVGNCEVVVEGNVYGFNDLPVTGNSVKLTLTEGYAFKDLEENQDISEWFTNIPKKEEPTDYKLIAKVSNVSSNMLVVNFTGMYDDAYEEPIEVTVPNTNIEGSVENDISNVPSELSKYKIVVSDAIAYYPDSYIVSGYVGEDLETNEVQIQLDGTQPFLDGEDYPLYSNSTYISSLAGLSFTTEYVGATNILTITYSGQPEVESDDLIHTIFTPELITNITEELVVPDRVDVKFDIKVREELEEETEEEQEPEEDDDDDDYEETIKEEKIVYVLPKTGVE